MLDDVKKLLGFTDTSNDEKLNLIISMVSNRLKMKIGSESIPDSLAYIVTEVSVARFNQIGSEGLASHSVEGEKMDWSNADFAPYMADINAYLATLENATRGKVRFI